MENEIMEGYAAEAEFEAYKQAELHRVRERMMQLEQRGYLPSTTVEDIQNEYRIEDAKEAIIESLRVLQGRIGRERTAAWVKALYE